MVPTLSLHSSIQKQPEFHPHKDEIGVQGWEMGDEEGQSHHLNGFYLQCALSDDSQELPAGSTKLRLSPQGRPHQACNVLGQCMRPKGNGLLRRLVRKSKKEEWNLVPRAPLLTAL